MAAAEEGDLGVVEGDPMRLWVPLRRFLYMRIHKWRETYIYMPVVFVCVQGMRIKKRQEKLA